MNANRLKAHNECLTYDVTVIWGGGEQKQILSGQEKPPVCPRVQESNYQPSCKPSALSAIERQDLRLSKLLAPGRLSDRTMMGLGCSQ